MMQLGAVTTRPAVGSLRGALLGALVAGVLFAGAGPALPVAAQEAPAGSTGGGQFTPRENDLDIDGLLNDDEVARGTDPNNSDTDGDGTSDGAEVNYGTDPLVPRISNDDDQDGLSNDAEVFYGTDPLNIDTDGDGVGDLTEIDGTGTNPLVPEEHVFTSLVDTDEDGIPDVDEPAWGTNPTIYDSDNDRIGDGWEAYHYGTSPLLDDTDQEGLSDSEELFTYGTDPLKDDTDGDGYFDGQEVHGRCPSDPRDPASGPRFAC